METDFKTNENVIVILGGMGPMAGIECFKYVVNNTLTNGTDQDNLNTLVISFPKHIENRVDYVLQTAHHNPAESALQFLEPQLQLLSLSYQRIILGAPCISFHCPLIFSTFEKRIKEAYPQVTLVSIVTSTIEFIHEHFPTIHRVGIMSTDGTRHAKPFHEQMTEYGFTMVYLNDKQQDVVSNCIYNTSWGIKSQLYDKERVHSLFCTIMDQLVEEKCELIILGCTEIPLAILEKEYKGVPILNPSWVMARELVRQADANKLKEL